ncbi:hypothetical protein HUJ04_003207 [Dendroctonus ponderosae]|uniref:C2H2-type domain-containing protein n=2 Tax=Dendroctonus ponderosae TaxID=77166 RepID=A0AAR5Q2D9_DENPD|nr:hypothetical protein HUJ04_003207 [Dendroctonus ponderosae]
MLKKGSFNLKMPDNNFHELVSSAADPNTLIDVYDPETGTLVKSSPQSLKQSFYKPQQKPPMNVVYQVVYPDDLNLKPGVGYQKSKSRVGRPKKAKIPQLTHIELNQPSQKSKVQVVAKTRSGREVKFPKHIQNDFKKIVTDDNVTNDSEIETADFVKYTEADKSKDKPEVIEEKPTVLDSVQKKRRIASQYRCPKCQKAYMGRSKILEHLKKNPTHGPMNESEGNHFEVWNYLVSITQKCPSSERGPKLCQELSNLLHNLLLLTNALFKKLGNASNEVKVDKVLGNAIGLAPGTYYFDDNNLYKDVTVLKLMSNTDFLNSIRSKSQENIARSPEVNCKCGKSREVVPSIAPSIAPSIEANDEIVKKIDSINIGNNDTVPELEKAGDKFGEQQFFLSDDVYSSLSDYEMKSGLDPSEEKIAHESKPRPEAVNYKTDLSVKGGAKLFPDIGDYNSFSISYGDNDDNLEELKKSPKSPKIKIQSNILLCPPNPKLPQSNFHSETSPSKYLLNTDLLIDNSVLLPIPNLHHGVDELMLPVTDETGILDNSSGSDEVMNVDQFVNERFRRITESDVGANDGSLSLELPALGLFPFNST